MDPAGHAANDGHFDSEEQNGSSGFSGPSAFLVAKDETDLTRNYSCHIYNLAA